jgi:hypothetical protein
MGKSLLRGKKLGTENCLGFFKNLIIYRSILRTGFNTVRYDFTNGNQSIHTTSKAKIN